LATSRAAQGLAAALLAQDDPTCADPVMAGLNGVSLPENVAKTRPGYPEEARSRRIAGKVLLSAVICRDGRVEEVTVLRPSARVRVEGDRHE
jgi:outer membrane biosynthesis protein TonB